MSCIWLGAPREAAALCHIEIREHGPDSGQCGWQSRLGIFHVARFSLEHFLLKKENKTNPQQTQKKLTMKYLRLYANHRLLWSTAVLLLCLPA